MALPPFVRYLIFLAWAVPDGLARRCRQVDLSLTLSESVDRASPRSAFFVDAFHGQPFWQRAWTLCKRSLMLQFFSLMETVPSFCDTNPVQLYTGPCANEFRVGHNFAQSNSLSVKLVLVTKVLYKQL